MSTQTTETAETTVEKKKYYSFTKKDARESLEAYFEANPNAVKAKVKEEILALFESKPSFGGDRETPLVTVGGNVVAKRCSYFGVFMPIDEFAVRAGKPNFQSKLAEKAQRDANKLKSITKSELEAKLAAGTITVDEWKAELAKLDAPAVRASLPEGVIAADTAEGIIEKLGLK